MKMVKRAQVETQTVAATGVRIFETQLWWELYETQVFRLVVKVCIQSHFGQLTKEDRTSPTYVRGPIYLNTSYFVAVEVKQYIWWDLSSQNATERVGHS